MTKYLSTHRFLFYQFSSIIIITGYIFPQESPNDFIKIKHSAQTLERNKVLSPHSNWYVVDTAIVFTAYDTSRYIYINDKYGNITETIFQRLISNKWVSSSHSLFTYDSNRNQLTYFKEDCYNDVWVNCFRHTNTYDDNKNQLTHIVEDWTNNQWENSTRETNSYDDNGNQLSYQSDSWLNNQWLNGIRRIYSYNLNGNLISKLYERWSNNQWEGWFRETYTYDSNGNQLVYFSEVVVTNYLWENHERKTYTYDINGNQLSYMLEQWFNNIWEKHEQIINAYDVKGNLISVYPYLWSNNQWINYTRTTYTYDENYNLILEQHQGLDSTVWVNFSRKTYTYESNGNKLSEQQDEWRINQWIGIYRFTYKYFIDSLWSEGSYEEWQNSSWVPSNIYFRLIDNAGNSFGYSGSKITIKYKLIITAVSKDDGTIATYYSLSQNFPNPFNPSTTISYSVPERSIVRLSIFNTLGQKISEVMNERKDAGNYEQFFNASQLSSGIYFYRIEATSTQNSGKTFVETKKMVLMK
jgi:hypothetical protein